MARSYSVLQSHRLLVVGLTIGLVTVIFGVMIDLVLSGQRTSISLPTQQLIAPLNPQLDLRVVEQVEEYEFVSFDQAREGVRQARLEESADALVELAPVESVPDVTTDLDATIVPVNSPPAEATDSTGVVTPTEGN